MPSHLNVLRLEGAKSDELRSAFACVSEATATDGAPRYSENTCRRLARMIVCRNYAKATHELGHLLAAVSHNGARFESVFWEIEKVTAGAFRHYFVSNKGSFSGSKFVVRSKEVAFRDEGATFAVSYSRMPFLAAFLDFLLTTIGFAELDDLVEQLRGRRINTDDIGRSANALQRLIYGYLKKHLPPAHAQRRERHFLDYVETQSGNKSGSDAIDDPTVLSYWCEYANDETMDARTYRSVYDLARRSILALDAAADQVSAERARPIGQDAAQGEVDPEDLEQMLSTMTSETSPLAELLDRCGDLIKVVHGSEAALLGEITINDRVTRRIPVSVLRSAVQGDRQQKLINAQRRFENTETVIASSAEGSTYAGRIERYGNVLEILERISYASLWKLHQAGAVEAITLALNIAPDIDWGALSIAGDLDELPDEGVISLSAHRAAMQFFAARPNPKGDEVEALLDESFRAWQKVNRRGFTNNESDASLDAVNEVSPHLLRLISRVREFLDRDIRGLDWDYIDTDDRNTFDMMFMALYGNRGRERERA